MQGGPGGSSTGFGNFQEIGPLDVDMKPRNTSWTKAANILFVDNPVGTGYSYVDKDSAYTTNVDEITADLVTLFGAFLKKYSVFEVGRFFTLYPISVCHFSLCFMHLIIITVNVFLWPVVYLIIITVNVFLWPVVCFSYPFLHVTVNCLVLFYNPGSIEVVPYCLPASLLQSSKVFICGFSVCVGCIKKTFQFSKHIQTH